MESQVNRLVDKVWDRYLKTPTNQRVLIAIAGIPGSGKTTLAHAVVEGLNKKVGIPPRNQKDDGGLPVKDPPEVAIAVPMDGFHLFREQLAAMPDPEFAFNRRGAEFTFDGNAFVAVVEALRQPINRDLPATLLPAFDHAVKDPVADQIVVGPQQRIVVFEGNYVCLNKSPWVRASKPGVMDERWFVDVDFAVARKRLIKRHVAAGIAEDEEAAAKRADENDLVNGREIVENKVSSIDETIVSREDASWS
ncbi:hypothetical protein SEUCBS139899_004379 [Sporothrix eucalyptigena]|uniref:Phosphoribulokinase/uridine kinase domain-containing protein n=1 Tax=Sporothrix eucalyptigena TaxID=1812306 RepID=A0ABP0C566_9PEZI